MSLEFLINFGMPATIGGIALMGVVIHGLYQRRVDREIAAAIIAERRAAVAHGDAPR